MDYYGYNSKNPSCATLEIKSNNLNALQPLTCIFLKNKDV